MKAITNIIFLFAIILAFTNCSGDDDLNMRGAIGEPQSDEQNTGDANDPNDTSNDSESGIVAEFDDTYAGIAGLPKGVEEYYDGDLIHREQYYYNPDGNLQKVLTHYQGGSGEDNYIYDSDGKLIKQGNAGLNYTFKWANGRITEADIDNPGAFGYGRAKIYYTYDAQSKIIEKNERYLDYDSEWKALYTYFGDGNLKSIEYYYQEGNGKFILYQVNNFTGYTDAINLFLEVWIIPGQSVQHNFPISKQITSTTEYGSETIYETYEYEYDAEGRVIAKTFGTTKLVYAYY